MVEHDSAVALDRLAERKPVYPGDERLQLCATDLEREPASVLAFELQKVVGVEGRLSCAASGSQRRKVAMAIRPEHHSLAIDHDVVDGQSAHRFRNSQKSGAVIRRVPGTRGRPGRRLCARSADSRRI